jgi:antitoxin ParD1/3/4
LDFEDAQSRDVVQLWPVKATITRVLGRPINENVMKGKGLTKRGRILCYYLKKRENSRMSAVEKISITLPAEMVTAIRSRVDAGSYASTSEVLREAMRLWLRQEDEYEQRMASVRARVKHSLEDPRPSLGSDEARDRLDAYYRRSQMHSE